MTEVGVLVDALSMHFGGGTTYLTEQLGALRRVAPHLRLTVLAGTWNADALAAVADDVEVVRTGDGLSRLVWEQVVLPRRSLSAPALLYCPGNSAPALRRSSLPVLLALQNPNWFGSGRRLPHNRTWNRRLRTGLTHRSARTADYLVTVSQALADDVLADLPELADRLSVIPSGCPVLPADHRRPARLPDQVGAGFVLSLANDAPHKRLDLVVRAWSHAFHDTPHAPPLVLAGLIPDHVRRRHGRGVPAALADRLVHVGPVDDRREVAWLLDHARVLVTAAATESFGFAPVEAGQLGCPVIASDIPAHREVAGSHITYVAVDDEAGFGDALRALPSDTPRPPWTWPVSWDDHARQLSSVIEGVATAGGVTDGARR
jgi:glycosyltransferase involved in cell wall biosynthesis